MADVNQELQDRLVRHQLGLIGLSSKTSKSLIKILTDIEDQLKLALLKYDPYEVSSGWRRRRIENQIEAIGEILAATYISMGKQLTEVIKEVSTYEVEYTSSTVGSVLPIPWNIHTPSVTQVLAAIEVTPITGRMFNEWIDHLSEASLDRIRSTIRQGYIQGRSTPDIIRSIFGTAALHRTDGVTEIGRRSIEALVRTGLNQMATHARHMVYDRNQDLLNGWRFTATLDGRTTFLCMSLDGNVYPINQGPVPPLHVKCRSTSVPIVKSWRELGIDADEADSSTRASLNGQVPGTMTYESWIKSQSVEFQNEVFGVRRAQEFRAGRIKLTDMVDKYGRDRTLEELKALDLIP